MIIQALLIAIIMFIAKFIDGSYFNIQVRPIWVGPLVGLALGDVQQGILMGAAIEAVFLGTFSVGGSVPSDVTSASIFGTAFGILLGKGTAAAVALSIPIGLLAVLLFNLINGVFYNFVVDFEDRAVANRNDKLFNATRYFTMFFGPVVYAIMAFVIMEIGVNPVKELMDGMPLFVNNALGAMSAALPALGMAILVNSMWDKQLLPFFFIGFILAAYLNLGTMPIAVLGAAFAVYYILTDFNKKKHSKSNGSASDSSAQGSDEMEDFLS